MASRRGEYCRLNPIALTFSWAQDEDSPEEDGEDEAETERKRNRWLKKKQNTELIAAIVSDADLEQVLSLLRCEVSPMVRCQQSMSTACHIAALKGRHDIIQSLLENSVARGLGTSVVLARDRAGRQPHHLAAAMGNLQTLKELLRAEPVLKDSQVIVDSNLDSIIREDQLDSFLHNHVEVSCLMPFIAEGSTVLHIAAKHNHLEVVKFLLSKNADPNIVDSEGFTPLDVAGMYASPGELMRNLSVASLRSSRDDLTRDNTVTDGEILLTPFSLRPAFLGTPPSIGRKSYKLSTFEADALNNTLNVVSRLIEGGGRLSEDRVSKRTTPLHKFVEKGDVKAIEEFLSNDNGFELSDIRMLLHTTDDSGRTPICLAVECQLLEPLKLLLNADSSAINIRNENGRTPLHVAVEKEWTRGIDILLEHNTDIRLPTADDETAIHIAARQKNHVILRTLLERASKSVVNHRDKNGYTALFRAIEQGSLECVGILLDFCKPRKYLSDASSLLHIAAKSNNVSVLRLLTERLTLTSQDINRPNREGLTPLHLAVREDCISCLDFLITLKHPIVDVEAEREGPDGGNIVHIASQLGRHQTLKRILSYSFSSNLLSREDRRKREPLILAAIGGHAECVELLLKTGANIAARDSGTEKTALEIIHYNIPHSARILDDIMDSFMTKSEDREDNPNFSVTLNYNMLLADLKQDGRQLGVIEAFIKCRHERLRHRLFLHPLTESFLFFKWNQLKIFFRILIIIFLIHILALTGLSIVTYVHPIPSYIIWPWKSVILIMNVLIFFLEYLHSRADKTYLMDIETWVKWSALITSTFVCVLQGYTWLRYLTAVSVLLAWFQLLFLIARNPRFGLRVLMFFEVAANVFQVLATFLFLILGFAFAFLILFNGQHPFTNIGATLSKIFIMMVELDYNGVYGSSEEDMVTSIGILGRILYLGFVVLVVMVLTNLIVGMSVTDVTELETQGKSKRISKQATFLVLFEKLFYACWWSFCIPQRLHRWRLAPNWTVVWPNKKTHVEENPLPEALRVMVRQTVLNRNEEIEEDNLHSRVQKLSDDVEGIYEILKEIKASLQVNRPDLVN